MADVEHVGGKNASLGEMISQLSGAGIRVPGGFATTAAAYRDFLAHNELDAKVRDRLRGLDVGDVRALAEAGSEIRQWIADAPLQPALAEAIGAAYAALTAIGARTPRLPCAPRPRPKTCPTPRSPASRKHSLISMAWTM